MHGTAAAKALETARTNAINANNTSQWLRGRVLELTSALERQSHHVAALEAHVQALAQRLADLEDRLA